MHLEFHLVLSILATLFLNSCCSCTEQACIPDDSPAIRFEINLDNHSAITADHLQALTIYKTDSEFQVLDSIQTSFVPVAFQSAQYYLILSAQDFDPAGELYAFNYLMKNRELNRQDTVSQISYITQITEEVCNECTGGISCDDDFYTTLVFSDPQFSYNDSAVTSFEVDYIGE